MSSSSSSAAAAAAREPKLYQGNPYHDLVDALPYIEGQVPAEDPVIVAEIEKTRQLAREEATKENKATEVAKLTDARHFEVPVCQSLKFL